MKLNGKAIDRYLAIKDLIEVRAEMVALTVLRFDTKSIIFKDIDNSCRVDSCRVGDIIIERTYNAVSKKTTITQKFNVRLKTTDGDSEQVSIDCSLLAYEGPELDKRVNEYLKKIAEPVLARRNFYRLMNLERTVEDNFDDVARILEEVRAKKAASAVGRGSKP